MKTYTAPEVKGMIEAIGKPFALELNAAMDLLPAAMRPGLQQVYDKLNTYLEGLSPIEQIPAAQQAGWAMESLVCALARFSETASQVMGSVRATKAEYAGRLTKLEGLETEMAGGLWLGKDAVTSLVASEKDKAKAEGRAEMLPEIRATRKTAIELAGLPLPADTLLDAPAAAWDAAVIQARENVAALTAKGLKVGGKGEKWVRETAWLAKTEFAGRMEVLADMPAPATPGRPPTPDPLRGPPGDPGNKPKVAVGMC